MNVAQVFTTKRKFIVLLFSMIGCMAERLKTQLLETDKTVDLVAGPGKVEILSLFQTYVH